MPKVIDLFCGCGGLSEGFKLAGYTIVGGVDFNKPAIDTYNKNFPEAKGICCDLLNMDQNQIIKEFGDLNDIDVIIGGPPCQGFSAANRYKIEGEDLYLIGTSEHSMIGKFIDQLLPEDEMPYTLTSYSPCFRKEKGAHGIEERGVYRIHQFEKQEMIVVCKPEDAWTWYNKLWQNTVDLFRSLDVPVRTLECCSGDLADLKVKSCDVEAWSPRQKKYFEVGSCSNLGDAQARRLKIRIKSKDGNYFAHTLNNTVVAPPRMLIAFLENNLMADGSVKIPEALRPYMGGKEILIPEK